MTISATLADILDLRLAWKRLKADGGQMGFVESPFLIKLIEIDADGWIGDLESDIRSSRFSPSPMNVCEVPKAQYAIRPGSMLTVNDQIVYSACVGACLLQIHATLAWSQGKIDFGHELAKSPEEEDWFPNEFKGWANFRDRSLEKIDAGATYVVIADIVGFYENIDLSILLSKLRETGAPVEAIDQIGQCLNKWAQVQGRGIPQGTAASHILAKLYLNSLDEYLDSQDYQYYRYVDDIRIFCRNKNQAKKALASLSAHLRKRGLNLNSAKSAIYRADEARRKIDRVEALIAPVRDSFVEWAKKLLKETDNPYISFSQAERILTGKSSMAMNKRIRGLYQTYFIDSSDDFEKTLFHFLLKRLGVAEDDFAVAHCLTLFEKYPEETKPILSYIAKVKAYGEAERAICPFLKGPDAVYPYQIYEMVDWLRTTAVKPSDELIGIIRKFAFDGSLPVYVRSTCRAFLARFGTPTDLERIQDSYDTAGGDMEKSELICCLAKLEKGKRNTFLGRVESDGELQKRAVRLVKSNSV